MIDRFFIALCRFSLLAFPRDFRRDFGDEMIDVWRDRRRAAGAPSSAALWFTIPIHALIQGLAERPRSGPRAAARFISWELSPWRVRPGWTIPAKAG